VRAHPHSPRHAADVPLHTSNCATNQGVIFSGIYVPGQVPTPSAAGWLLDLTAAGGPMLAVLRRDRVEATAVAVGHLLDAWVALDAGHARAMVAAAEPQLVAVTW
jgi:hypothetical protein